MCCSLHTAECAQELPNAFARPYVKKRSHAGRRRALFPERDGGSIDLNTKSMFHTEEMSLVSSVICSNSSTSTQLTRERLNDSREYNWKKCHELYIYSDFTQFKKMKCSVSSTHFPLRGSLKCAEYLLQVHLVSISISITSLREAGKRDSDRNCSTRAVWLFT